MESGFVEASCRRLCFNYSSARRPCPQASQWHPRVAKGTFIDPLARRPYPQTPQWHPCVAKGTFIDPLAREPSTEPLLGQGHVARLYGTGVKPVSCRCLGRTSARRSCPQMPQWHPRVAKRSSERSSARHPCPQVPQCYPRVAKRSSERPSERRPCPQASQWHPCVAKEVF